jgi:hypothetical protein
MRFGQERGRTRTTTDQWGFIYALDLPDDATAITLEQLDQLIAYYDRLSTRYDEALTQLDAVRDQTGAAVGDSDREVPGGLRGSNARGIEALAEYSWCRREIEAIGAYAEPLKVEAEV